MTKSKTKELQIVKDIQQQAVALKLDLKLAGKIQESFTPYIIEAQPYIDLVKTLNREDPNCIEEAQKAARKLGSICQRYSDVKKEQKEESQKVVKFIDAMFNAVEGIARIAQAEAKEIADYLPSLERARIQKITDERTAEISPFMQTPEEELSALGSLGEMSENQFDILLTGYKTRHEQRTKAEAEAQKASELAALKEKLARERKDELVELSLYNFIDNAKDLNLSELDEKAYAKLKESAQKTKLQYESDQAKIKAENDKLKAAADAQAKLIAENEAKQRKEKEEAAAKAKIEAEKLAKLQAELEARLAKEKAEQAQKQKELAEQQAAPERQRLINYVKSIKPSIATPEIKDAALAAKLKDIQAKFAGFERWAIELIEKK